MTSTDKTLVGTSEGAMRIDTAHNRISHDDHAAGLVLAHLAGWLISQLDEGMTPTADQLVAAFENSVDYSQRKP